MKIKKDYILREVLGEYIVIPSGQASLGFNGIMSINGVGKSIWDYLQAPMTKEELVEMMFEEYEVDLDILKNDIEEFIQRLQELNILEN